MRLLELKSVDKFYNSGSGSAVHAVKKFDLDAGKGEIVALLGSSGCGKTSTLRMIAGFEEVSAGEILLKGSQIHNLAPAKRGVAMAFEGYALYPPLSVRENIAFALKAEKASESAVGERVNQIAKLLEIEDILDKRPNSISGGQQQRVSLGRALIRNADLHVLDEPMGQLEPQLRALLRGRIKHHIKEHQFTAILVTHDQTEANALADRIAVMEDGVLQQFDTPQNLRDRPVNVFTGSFIGEPPMNIFNASVELDERTVRFRLAEDASLEYPLTGFSTEICDRIGSIGSVMIGIRPHSVRIGDQGASAEIFANQWLGDQSHIAAKFAGKNIVSVIHHRLDARTGDRIQISIAVEDLHLFEAESGRAISHGGELA